MRLFSEGNKWWPVRIAFAGLVLWMLSRPRMRAAAIIAVLASLLANETTDVIKGLWPTLRPSDPASGMESVNLRVAALTSSGTASAHAANMAAVATALMRLAPKLGAVFVVVALFTGISRVYVGVHFPYQVILGWTSGLIVAWVLVEAYRWWDRRRETLRETSGPNDPLGESAMDR